MKTFLKLSTSITSLNGIDKPTLRYILKSAIDKAIVETKRQHAMGNWGYKF